MQAHGDKQTYKMDHLTADSNAKVRSVKRVQFGILSPEMIDGESRPSSVVPLLHAIPHGTPQPERERFQRRERSIPALVLVPLASCASSRCSCCTLVPDPAPSWTHTHVRAGVRTPNHGARPLAMAKCEVSNALDYMYDDEGRPISGGASQSLYWEILFLLHH